jgi:ribA/ribD-fused uncharacterized protein
MNFQKSFSGDMEWASNFYDAPIIFDGEKNRLQEIYPQFQFDALKYRSTEHLFQALKATNHDDKELVRLSQNPAMSKKNGKKIFMRMDWPYVKQDAMRVALFLKFTQHPDLLIKLLQTDNDPLVEYNSWGDTYWGVCTKTGKGENWLGRLLMELRAHARLMLNIDF